MSERDQFEAWWSSYADVKMITVKSKRASRGGYFDEFIDRAWHAWKASREALQAEQVATAHRLVNKRSGQVHPWVYTEGKIDASEGDIFRVEVMPLYTAPPFQPHPIDTTSQQYETLAKGGGK